MKKTITLILGVVLAVSLSTASRLHADNSVLVKGKAKDLKKKVEEDKTEDKKPAATNASNPKVKAPAK